MNRQSSTSWSSAWQLTVARPDPLTRTNSIPCSCWPAAVRWIGAPAWSGSVTHLGRGSVTSPYGWTTRPGVLTYPFGFSASVVPRRMAIDAPAAAASDAACLQVRTAAPGDVPALASEPADGSR